MIVLNSTLVEPTMTAWDWAMGNEDMFARDQRRVAKAMPLETWIPLVWFLNQFIED